MTPTGKRVFVRQCWVGDASKGTVFKDYKVGDGGTAMPANVEGNRRPATTDFQEGDKA